MGKTGRNRTAARKRQSGSQSGRNTGAQAKEDEQEKQQVSPEPEDDYVPDEGEEVLIADLMRRFGWVRARAIREVKLL